jgi:hypothetical protein
MIIEQPGSFVSHSCNFERGIVLIREKEAEQISSPPRTLLHAFCVWSGLSWVICSKLQLRLLSGMQVALS